MKRCFVAIAMVILLSSVSVVSAQEQSLGRFEKIVKSMVKAINDKDYAGVQKDFGPVMLQAFPLDKTKAFFGALTAQYGKIERLGPGQITGPGQAVFPAYFERGTLNIKLVLDGQNKVAGLWFLPPSAADSGQETDAEAEKAKAGVFEKLEEQLDKLVKSIRRLVLQWTKDPDEEKIDLTKSILRRNSEELKLVRELAVQEEAVKTVDAIDKLLAARDEHLEKAVETAEKKIEKEKLKAEKRGRREQEGVTDSRRSTGRDKDREARMKEREERRKEREERRRKREER